MRPFCACLVQRFIQVIGDIWFCMRGNADPFSPHIAKTFETFLIKAGGSQLLDFLSVIDKNVGPRRCGGRILRAQGYEVLS